VLRGVYVPTLRFKKMNIKILLFPATILFSFSTYAEGITIGVIAPLTVASIDSGEEIMRTVEILTEQLSTENLKHTYKFKVQDGKCGVGNSATTAAQKLISVDGANYLIAGCSGETIQAGIIGQQRRVIVIGVLASDPAVRELGDYIFRTYVDIEEGVSKISEKIVKDGGRRVAIFTEDVPFTQKIESLLIKNLGSKVVMRETFPPNYTEFNSFLTKAKGLKADTFYFNGANPQTVAALVNQSKVLNLKQPQYSYYMPGAKVFRNLTGSRSDGIVYLDVPDVMSKSEYYNEFAKLYIQKFPS